MEQLKPSIKPQQRIEDADLYENVELDLIRWVGKAM